MFFCGLPREPGSSMPIRKPIMMELNVMKRRGLWGLAILVSALLGGAALSPTYVGASALKLGYCASDFDVCYNSCRINHPEASFAGDRARVICGQGCAQNRQQCEVRAGGVVRSAPQQIAPFPQHVRPAQQIRRSTAAPSAKSVSQTPTEVRETGLWGWFKPRERTKSIIPGK